MGLIKWDLLKKKRKELLSEVQLKIHKKIRALVWLKMVVNFITVKKFENTVRTQILEKIKRMKFAYTVTRIKIRWRV